MQLSKCKIIIKLPPLCMLSEVLRYFLCDHVAYNITHITFMSHL